MRSIRYLGFVAALAAAVLLGPSHPADAQQYPVPQAGPQAAILPVVSQGASTLLGKAAPGNLYNVYLTATADSWLMVFNQTTAPTNGATTAGSASGNLQECIKVPSGTSNSITYPQIPEMFTVGIYFAISSTACSSLTLATTGIIHAQVK